MSSTGPRSISTATAAPPNAAGSGKTNTAAGTFFSGEKGSPSTTPAAISITPRACSPRSAAPPEPLAWAKRLSQRYVETRDSQDRPGRVPVQPVATRPGAMTSAGSAATRAQYQYGDDFKGHRVVEGALFPSATAAPRSWNRRPAGCSLGEALGAPKAATSHARPSRRSPPGASPPTRAKDNAFIPMLTDGTSLEGYVCKKDGYFGPQRPRHDRRPSRTRASLDLRAGLPPLRRAVLVGDGPEHRPGATAGATSANRPKNAPALRPPGTRSDPFLLFALLELHRAAASPAFSCPSRGRRPKHPQTTGPRAAGLSPASGMFTAAWATTNPRSLPCTCPPPCRACPAPLPRLHRRQTVLPCRIRRLHQPRL